MYIKKHVRVFFDSLFSGAFCHFVVAINDSSNSKSVWTDK